MSVFKVFLIIQYHAYAVFSSDRRDLFRTPPSGKRVGGRPRGRQGDCLCLFEPEFMSSQNSLLRIPKDFRLAVAASSFVGKLALELGLSAEESRQIESAAVRLLETVMERRGVEELDVHIESGHHEFRLRVVDKGIPTTGFSALHSYLNDDGMNEVHFNYLGQDGNESVLVRHLARAPGPPVLPEVDARSVPQDFTLSIRRMTAEEAIEVARCIYTAYGYSYPVEAVYLPEKLASLNATDEMITAVAVTDDGQIVSTMSLEAGFGKAVMDVGLAATYPEFQSHGAAGKLQSFLAQEAVRCGVLGMTTWTVTAHVYSQKLIRKHLSPCALLVGNAPNAFHFSGFDQSHQRGSVVGYYRDLTPPDKPISISVPDHHYDMVETLMKRLGWKPERLRGVEKDRPKHSELLIRANQKRAGAILTLRVAGADALTELRTAHERLRDTGTVEFLLMMDLEDPGTADLAEALEQDGFFFCGVMPRTACGHALLLQSLHSEPLDYEKILLWEQEALDLRDYVQRHDPHQGAGRATKTPSS